MECSSNRKLCDKLIIGYFRQSVRRSRISSILDLLTLRNDEQLKEYKLRAKSGKVWATKDGLIKFGNRTGRKKEGMPRRSQIDGIRKAIRNRGLEEKDTLDKREWPIATMAHSRLNPYYIHTYFGQRMAEKVGGGQNKYDWIMT